MLCLPGNVPLAIKKIKEAIDNKRLSWEDIEVHCKRVLLAKYQYVLPNVKLINTTNLTEDLNRKIPGMKKQVAENAITLLSGDNKTFFPLKATGNTKQVAFIGIGLKAQNLFSQKISKEYNAKIFYFDYLKKIIMV